MIVIEEEKKGIDHNQLAMKKMTKKRIIVKYRK